MACSCKHPDGSYMEKCIGSCIKESIIQQQENAKRDPLNGYGELILSQVDKIIDYKLKSLIVKFEKEKIEIWKEAFCDGLKNGIEIVKKINRDNDDY